MCGIAGELRLADRAHEAVVEHQLQQLLHRGPDAIGVYARGGGAVGQTRLSIIDLRTGDPPQTDESGEIGVVCNGEIYNFAELRRELAGRHTYASAGDTEVIAHLAEETEPVELARRLDGMFAAAIWDVRRRRLVLLRDRLGKKPLYYWQGSGVLVFASEIKGVLAHPAVSADLDAETIPAFLRFGYVPSPRTMFRGVRSVPPGHVLVADDDGVRTECYWRPSASGMEGTTLADLSLHEAGAEVRRVLTRAVRRRLVADVPLGAFLSGGLDSSAIVSIMAAETSSRVRTFTIGFGADDAAFDERSWAGKVAERFDTEHHTFVVDPDAVELVESLVHHHDQPFGDSSAIPTYLLSELTAEHVTVALCGDGGDELFAGYERFAAAMLAGRLERLPGGPRRSLAATLAAASSLVGHGVKARRFLRAGADGMPTALREWVSVVGDDALQQLAGGDGWERDDYQRHWDGSAGAGLLDRILLLNLETYLLDDLLPKVDRTSMAHGLEVRAPFLDRELVELALRLPAHVKLRGMTGKRCLRAGFRGILPDEVIDRPKKGFGVPVDRWFRHELDAYVSEMLGGPTSSVVAHVDPDRLHTILSEHRAGVADHGAILWSLLTLEVFLRRHGW